MMRVVLSIFAEATRAFARGESTVSWKLLKSGAKQLAHSREVRDEAAYEYDDMIGYEATRAFARGESNISS